MKLFTKTMAVAIAIAAFSLPTIAKADVIANWTFETSVPLTAGPHAAEFGIGSATGLHASGSAAYSNPAGNGSVESFSSNFWAPGDYYQFSVSTVGLENIKFTWDQTGSNTGPRDFDLQYDAGSGFSSVFSYILTNDAWNATYNPISTRTFDFSAITATDNNATVLFRLTNIGTTAITGGTVATAGTGRVDNILIEGFAIPEPTTAGLGLIGLAGMMMARRRRTC